MSLHSYEPNCEHKDGAILWNAACHCGWEGGPHHGSANADASRRDYRDHVEEALGAEAYYTAPVFCVNCAYRGEANLLIGTDVWSGLCPRCGASGRLRPEALYDEQGEAPPWRFFS